MTYPATDHGPDVPAGGVDTDGEMLSPRNHPADGPGIDYGMPPQYAGPDVPDLPPLVNPSAGPTGSVEQGMNDVNPR